MTPIAPAKNDPIQQIKRLTIIALFSDDELLDRLVLKGGNALALVYRLDTRVSADLDLSMETAFDPAEMGAICERIKYQLEQTFKPKGWVPFDVNFVERPPEVSEDLADFWGGYHLDFKLIDVAQHERLDGDLEKMRRSAQTTGPGDRKRFEVDISRYELCEPKQASEIDGYTVYVYTPLLLVCEKLRAVCQQMPEYDAIVRRHRGRRTARPRDFFDIHTVLTHFSDINLDTPDARELLAQVFACQAGTSQFSRAHRRRIRSARYGLVICTKYCPSGF